MKLFDRSMQILRISRMEKVYNAVFGAFHEGHFRPEDDPAHGELLRILKEYYEGPLWKEDYAADERGELPSHMKRGVLSQDAVYNLLAEIEEGNV